MEESPKGEEHQPPDNRLWIGNLDSRINEFQLLKLMQKHGTIDKFDLLFYRTGPLAGQPRGYAFVTFAKQDEAIAAKESLNNKLLGSKRIVVKWAHTINESNMGKDNSHLNIPVLSGPAKGLKRPSRESQIQAIEAKLKFMQRGVSPEFELKPPVVKPSTSGSTTTFKHNRKHSFHESKRRK